MVDVAGVEPAFCEFGVHKLPVSRHALIESLAGIAPAVLTYERYFDYISHKDSYIGAGRMRDMLRVRSRLYYTAVKTWTATVKI